MRASPDADRRLRLLPTWVLSGAMLAGVSAAATAAETGYENLQVLPSDISRGELGEIMLDNLRGLGLPRLAGEGCLYCHVGDLEVPRSEWDYASDDKPMKRKARVMMRMVEEINKKHLAGLNDRVDSSNEVTCASCHAGRTDPRPLPEVLWAIYETDGAESAAARYRELRERFFGADAYDFRPHVLPGIATRMADAGSIDDAIAMAELNAEVFPGDVFAQQARVALVLERTIDRSGPAAALEELSRMEEGLAPGVMTPGLLDALAWRLNRTDRETQGHALIEANYERFPGEYRAIESLAFIRSSTGRMPEAVSLLEKWLEENPEHARARRLLVNLTRKADG